MNKYPENWQIEKLGNLCKNITKGTTPKTYESKGVNFIKVESILETHTLLKEKFAKISIKTNENLKRSQLKEGDILFAIAGSLGKLAEVNQTHLPANTNQALAIVRLENNSVDRTYCKYQLTSSAINQRIMKLGTIGAQPNLSLKQVFDFEIPIPPLHEQKKIAEIISGIESLILQKENLFFKKKIINKNLLSEIIENDSTKKILSVNQLIDSGHILKIKDGNHGSQYPRSHEFLKSGIPFINASLINEQGEIDFNNCSFLSEKRVQEMHIPPATAGDVILTHNATVGRVSIIPIEIKKVVLSTSTTFYRLNNELLDSNYLAAFFKSSFYQQQLLQIMGQTTRNQVPITAQKELKILLPSMEIQRKIASISSSFAKDFNLHFAKLSKLKLLKQSISNDLLSGRKRVNI